jgi:hypothetical protein
MPVLLVHTRLPGTAWSEANETIEGKIEVKSR